ncbi:MAG: recombinase family protein [Clostridia bacterium]|nr:recombinase family protein [Clostridia bacterium]
MVYGYARVSTKGQDRHGNSLQDQIHRLRDAGCEIVYQDSFTGTKMDRPEFSKLLTSLHEGDTLIVTKLDRFARTAADGAKTVQELVARGVEVDVLNMGRADNTPMGKLMVQIMFAFAEFERDMIIERTSTGKAVAKANDPDWREGRKRKEVEKFEVYRALQQRREITVEDACDRLGISKATWYARIREGVS